MSDPWSPPYTPADQMDAALRSHGFAVLAPDAQPAPLPLARWAPLWAQLPPDGYLRDGGRYRYRRHGSFVVEGTAVRAVPQRPHWQPTSYNALHGGILRHYEPLPAVLQQDAAWVQWLAAWGRCASALRGEQPWYVEAHPFRIDTAHGIGRPTPEGAHRDGVQLVVVTLIDRQGVQGGETRVFEADSPHGQRFTLAAPGSTLVLDDERMIHETTPIQPAGEVAGHRDTLVLTYRSGGFQGPDSHQDQGDEA